MAEATLNHAELQALLKALDYVLPELRHEIADTDDSTFRARLKQEEALLRSGRDKLERRMAELERQQRV